MVGIHWCRLRTHYLATAGMRLYAAVSTHLLAELAPTETGRCADLCRVRESVHDLIVLLRSQCWGPPASPEALHAMRELRTRVEALMAATPQFLEWASPTENPAELELHLARGLESYALELDRFEGLLRATGHEEVMQWAC